MNPELLSDPTGLPPFPGAPVDPAGSRELRTALADWEQFGLALPHELKAPLGLLHTFATLLQEREAHTLSPRGRLWLDHLCAAASQASSLADALLALAPLSLQPMQRVPVDLSALATQIIDLERAATPDRQAQVTIEPGLTTFGDPNLLRTLLSNLLGNAWKYTATRQQPRIAFGIVHGSDGGPAFRVRDNGVGFDMEHASRLFRPFGRLHARSEFEGVGLGLVIARQVVERHGGRIWIEAAPDQGTGVFFRLGDPGARR